LFAHVTTSFGPRTREGLGSCYQEFRCIDNRPEFSQFSALSDLIHPDHLNTPRLVADATGTTVWRWDQTEPFGNSPADENPSSLGTFDLPLRFPGQRYDAETALHYNYFRDYDPGLGIYKQSDPIGLRGGLNTYAYAAGNPISRLDPTGLDVTVAYYPGGVGHLGIAINSGSSMGFYPVRQTLAMITCSTVPGVVARDQVLQAPADLADASIIRIKTEPWQDALMESYISQRQNAASPGYNLCVDQCHSFVHAVLDSGGISHPGAPDTFSRPAGYYDALRLIYGGQARKR
jgi:RHS repeat-associated protein